MMIGLFRNRLFLAISSGHFVVDVLNGIGPVLMAVLGATLGLSYAQIGLALTLYLFAGSLSQPVFGWLADRFPGKPVFLAGVGTLWMALSFSIIAFQTNWNVILPLFMVAALGSGLFHPIGTAAASAAHRERAGTATAVFFFCGQVGLAAGPVLGGVLISTGSNMGILVLCGVALLPALLMLTAPAAPAAPKTSRRGGAALQAGALIITAFIVLVALRSSIQAAYTAFLPTLFASRGWEPTVFGALAGLFMFTAAFGNVITGNIADRFGMRPATVWPLLLSIPAGLLCLWAPTIPLAFVGSALAGLLVGGQHSVLVVHAQRLLPVRAGFAAGLILGFTFASGGIGTWLGGIIADDVGLLPVLQAITLLALPSALLALTLPGRAVAPAAAVEPSAPIADAPAQRL